MPIYRLGPSIKQTHRVLMDAPETARRSGAWKKTLLVAVFLLGGGIGAAAAMLAHERYGHEMTPR